MEIKRKLSCAFTVPKYTGMGWVRDLHGFLVKIVYLCVLYLMCSVTYTLHFLEGNIVSRSWCRRHMWLEFVVGSLLCFERFFSRYSGFPISSKTNVSKFQFDQESGRRRTIMCYLQIVICFIYESPRAST